MIYFIFAIVFSLVIFLLANQENFYENKYYKKYFKNKYYPKIITKTGTFHCARFISDGEELVATSYKLDLYHYVAHGTLGFDIYVYEWKDFEEQELKHNFIIKNGSRKEYQEFLDEQFQQYITDVYLPSI